MSATLKAHAWLGVWDCEAPLTPEQLAEDRPLLEAAQAGFPDGVTLRTLEVWVNGREYRWRRLDVSSYNR